METKILVSGIIAIIIGYVLFKKFWEMQGKSTIEQELEDVLTNENYKVKGKHE